MDGVGIKISEFDFLDKLSVPIFFDTGQKQPELLKYLSL